MKKKTIILSSLIALMVIAISIKGVNASKISTTNNLQAKYLQAWCAMNNGIEKQLIKNEPDLTCVTNTHTVSVDVAEKWDRSIGLALQYNMLINKPVKVILVVEKPSDFELVNRVKTVLKEPNFTVEYVTPDSLQIDK